MGAPSGLSLGKGDGDTGIYSTRYSRQKLGYMHTRRSSRRIKHSAVCQNMSRTQARLVRDTQKQKPHAPAAAVA